MSTPCRLTSRIERLSVEEGLRTFRDIPLHELRERSIVVRNAYNDPGEVTYIVDTNPNYSNVCTAGCGFCAFQAHPGSTKAYVLSVDEVMGLIAESVSHGATTVLLQGGLHPELGMDYYKSLVGESRNRFPGVTPHFFSAPEVQNMAEVNHLSVREVLEHLFDAGQRTLPGAGAEILTNRVREQISPGKMTAAQWLEVHEIAHDIGMRSTATMMYGHCETPEDIVEHLFVLRELQDKTGGFTAFIPWSYKTVGSRVPSSRDEDPGAAYYRILAFSRLFLDNFPHIQASWFSEGKAIGMEALHYGADDFGGTLLMENVHKAAMFTNTSSVEGVCQMIREAGYMPCQRTTLYERVPS